jgi:beta-galactosidase
MRFKGVRYSSIFAILFTLAWIVSLAQKPKQVLQPSPDLSFPTVLYGVAYYNEYMPGDDADHAARLEKDVALMKAAGLTVVRMGEIHMEPVGAGGRRVRVRVDGPRG